MNINFVFDKIDQHKVFKPNIIDISWAKGLRPNWPQWGVHIHRHLPYDKKISTKHILDFIAVDDVGYQDEETLNLYPICIHTTALEYPWPLVYISQQVIDLVNEDKLKIFLTCTFENSPEDLVYLVETIHNMARHQMIQRLDNIIIACTDFKFPERILRKEVQEVLQLYPLQPKFVNLDIYQSQTLHIIFRHFTDYKIENFLEVYSNTKKSKVFLYLNGRVTEWRYLLFKNIEMEGLLPYSLYTFRNPGNIKKALHVDNVEDHWINSLHKDLATYIKLLPNIATRQLDEQHSSLGLDFTHAPLEVGCWMDKLWIGSTYFSVVTETHIGHEVSQVTEKLYKLFYYCHPFIVLGSKGILKELHRLGYKTFPELFNESYDNMHYGVEKIKFITHQIKQYTTPEGQQKLEKLMPKIIETLAYNREKFISQDIYDRYANLK